MGTSKSKNREKCYIPSYFPESLFGIKLTISQINILSVLAESISEMSIYGLTNVKIHEPEERFTFNLVLGAWQTVNSNVRKLSDQGLVVLRKDKLDSRERSMVRINLIGCIVYFLAIDFYQKKYGGEYTKSLKTTISTTLFNHKDLFPLSSHWINIKKIIDEDLIINELLNVCKTSGAILHFQIDDPKLEFNSFIPVILKSKETLIVGDGSKVRDFQDNNKFLRYIKRNEDLSKILQSYLILKDLFCWYCGYKDGIPQKYWNSEKISAFLEDREVSDNPIFKNRRFGEFFPEYADIKYSFTGIFFDRFIWDEIKSVPQKALGEIKEGIRITLA